MKKISMILCLLLVFSVCIWADLSPVGKLKLTNDWNCDKENDGSITIIFKIDGTFEDSEEKSGNWETKGNKIFWEYYNSQKYYMGILKSGIYGEGKMKNDENDCSGSWSLKKIYVPPKKNDR